jgi:CheY-like chemotaxis protein
LVVEDDPQLRRLYQDSLRLIGGYTVVAAEDGVAALRYCDTAIPEAVVLDLGLPRLSGRDVQQELATHLETRDIPIIVVTGDSSSLNIADFACVLRKPIDVADLVAAVQRCLRE